jgi:antitoxin HigA-1
VKCLATPTDQLVEQPAIALFADLGWQTVSAMDEVFAPGGTLGREMSGGAAQHSHQRPVAHLLCLEGRRRPRRRDCGLLLKENDMAKRKFEPVHPGAVLAEDFLKGLEISQYRLAKGIGVPPRRINEIVHGKCAITADTALRLAKFFGMEAQFWMNLQSHYDLEVAKDAIAGVLDRDVEVLKAA